MARLYFQAFRETVGTTPSQIFRFYPKNLHSFIIKATAALSIGNQDVTTSTGFGLSAGEYLGVNHLDFDKSKLEPQDEVAIYGVAAVATTAQVLYFYKSE